MHFIKKLLKDKRRITHQLREKIKKLSQQNRDDMGKTRRISTVQDVTIPRNPNPIIAYYFGDRLFTFEGSKIVSTVIFNNHITKRFSSTKLHKKLRLIQTYWTDVHSKAGIGHPKHLIERLENSNDKNYYYLSQLIKK